MLHSAKGREWAEMLTAWAIPEGLVAAAPASPYFFDPNVFIAAADEAMARADDSPSDEVARQALPAGGSVLDVACGAGAASVRLRPGRLTGVDPSAPLLRAFAERAGGLDHSAATIEGTWPDVADRCDSADVVVCHHVFYNEPRLSDFGAALDNHARRRVVVELTAEHPMRWMAPYWQALHGLAQPDRPIVEDAVAVLEECGFTPHQHRWKRRYQMIGENGDESLQRIARRLCLTPDRHGELRRILDEVPPPVEREVVTLWWP